MHDQDPVAGQSIGEGREIVAVALAFIEIVNPCEAFVRLQPRSFELVAHALPEEADPSRFGPGQTAFSQLSQWHRCIANPGPLAGRKSDKKFDELFADSGELMRVEVPIDEVRMETALLHEEFILSGDVHFDFGQIQAVGQ